MADREITGLIREAERQGWIDATRLGHTKLRAPDGTTVVMPRTASDHRSIYNAIAIMRRHGFVWKGR
jgi:hypothetical protein